MSSNGAMSALGFYPKEFPVVGEKVWVHVIGIDDDDNTTVQLLEYGNREGMLRPSEVSRIRIRSVHSFIKVGGMTVMEVLSVDQDKGFIDLSKKTVTPSCYNQCEYRYHKSKDICSIVCRAADVAGIDRRTAMEMVAYPLYRQIGMGGMSVWALFERASFLASNGDEELLGMLPTTVPPTLKDELIKEIRHRVRPRAPAKISAELEVTCFAYEGINAIRDVLRFGKCFGETLTPSIPLTVTVVGSPKYEISAVTEHEEEGLKRLGDAIEAMKTAMAERQGTVKVVQKPSRTDNGGIVMPQQGTEGVEVTPTSNVGANRVERGNKKASAGYHRRHPAEGSRESLLGSNERF